MEVDRDDFGDAPNDRVAAGETSSIPGAISDRDHPFGIGGRVIGALQCFAHVFCNGTGHHQNIGMARRGDKPQAETFDVVVGVVKPVNFELASIARSGVDLADLDITVIGSNQLTIKGQRRPLELRGGAAHRQERAFGAFVRSVTLPTSLDADKIEAKLENGVLKLTLPKHEAAKPRKIAVKA